MSWIRLVDQDQAAGALKSLYGRIATPGGRIDNILKAHGLRPHTLEGHMALYKSVLHHAGNRLPRAWLETLGVYVSHLNRCNYCVEHHFAGLKRLLGDDRRAHEVRAALESSELAGVFDEREQAMLSYARALTRQPPTVVQAQVEALRAAGLEDGEILEVNQVVAYFAYANRTALGLGISTTGDALGLSPGSTAADWRHC
ncbi:MAG TPA: peroxidase-related enzyme [Gammaproteobacteria bacterium]|nr:peroxidase-related enzyme [Gammaproteobacteria bacterium]